MTLRIGIDGTCLALRRGYGRYLRELLPRLLECDNDNEYVLFVDRQTGSEVPPWPLRKVEPDTSEGQAAAASARGSRRIRDLVAMGRAVAREKLDLMYFPSVYSYYPVLARVKLAVAFHDTIAERYSRIVFPTFKARWLWKIKVAAAWRAASGVITVSEWSKRSLAEWFGVSEERIYVTPEAPSLVFRPVRNEEICRQWFRDRGLPADEPYFIYVGGFNPHKNLPRLARAFAQVAHNRPGEALRLIVVGDYRTDPFHAEVETLRRVVTELGVTERVSFVGFVPDEELRHLYAGAFALVLPSFEEGFGLPAVEAAACGTPCVATSNSPLPELLRGGGLFVDPEAEGSLCEALSRISGEPLVRAQLAQKALQRSRALSWGATAEATRHALVSIAGATGIRNS